jgi:AraC-like DNA-binding protein
MFYLTGVGLSFFLCLLLVAKRNKSHADGILALWLFLVTAHLLMFYFMMEGLYPQLLGVDMSFPLLHGPFLYAYTRALTDRPLSGKAIILHLLPATIVVVRLIPFYFLSTDEKQEIFASNGAAYETFNKLKYLAIVVSGILYIILSSLALRKHRRAIVEEFSNTEKINFAWLQYLIYWIGAIWIGVLISNETLIFSTVVLLVGFIGFFGIRQTTIFHSVSREPSIVGAEDDAGKKKYQKSGLNEETAVILHNNLTQLMQQEKVFRDSELSLSDLAARINTPPNYLSQVINDREGKSFYDYINTLRVEEFKRLAAGPDSRKYTLLGLAQECGFNSKSTFNRYFKKVTGTSPSQFVPELQD